MLETLHRHSGQTSWGTWLSCEENNPNGRVFETFPDGSKTAVITQLGKPGNPGGSFESVAQDDSYCFYVTNDSGDGELRRYCPAQATIDAAVASGDFTNLLTSTGGTMHYLLLSADKTTGSISWTTSIAEGKQSAIDNSFTYAEGIDFRDGKIYFVSKVTKLLFILDLANGTFERYCTQSGFNNQPDQIGFVPGDDVNGVMYFCEEGGGSSANPNGVYGRDSTTRFFTVLDGPNYNSETSGLAFNPSGEKMYVSYQATGQVFEVWRTDGCAFNAETMDIIYN